MLRDLYNRSYLLRMLVILFRIDGLRGVPLLLLAVVRGVIPAVDLWIIARIVDELVNWNGDLISTLGFWLVLMIGLRIVGELVSMLIANLGVRIRDRTDIHLKRVVFDHIGKVGLIERESSEYADRVKRANAATDPARITQLLENIPQTISEMAGIVSVIGLLFYVFWVIPLLNIIVLTVCLVGQTRAANLFFASFRSQTKEERLLETFEQTLFSKDRAGEVRFFGFGRWLIAKWETLFVTFSNQRRNITNQKARTGRVSEWALVSFLPTVSALALIVLSENVTIGNVVLALQSTQHLSSKFYFLAFQFQAFIDTRQTLRELFLFLDEIPHDNRFSEVQVKSKALRIECNDVSFTYPNQALPALKHVSLDIESGEHIAIVGENGAGKSTLVKLIMGMYTPSSGWLKVTDIEHAGDSTNVYRMSSLFQDYVKYQYTLRENIGFGDLPYIHDSQRLMRTVASVELTDVVSEVGLDRQIGREFDGIEFSGGEWQRIALSRALFREDCGLIVLDEPTAALDAFSEAKILRGFLQIDPGRTCLFVSHRLASVRLADRVVVLKDGQVVETGTHRDLLEYDGEYKRLFHSQVTPYM